MSSPGSRRLGRAWPRLASGLRARLAAEDSPSSASRRGGAVGSRYVFIASPTVALSRSTSMTRTLTLSPGESSASRSSTRPSATREMCTRPSTPSAILTNAPHDSTVLTVPSMNSAGSASMYLRSSSAPAFFLPPLGLRSRGGPRAAPSGFRESESCFLSWSILRTRTLTASPSETTAFTSDTKSAESSEMCTRPSDCAPMSTKQP
mmetsp:Transcript_12313/g.37949  ORF Transcript_12313/g.37949 Transcript_12313/m.37949 type:complete len:206 (+) Transcript_12313:185-802(+)